MKNFLYRICNKNVAVFAFCMLTLPVFAICPCYDAWIAEYNDATNQYENTDCTPYLLDGPSAFAACLYEREVRYDSRLNAGATAYEDCLHTSPC